VITSVGTIDSLDQYSQGLPNGEVHLNDRGQVVFAATVKGGGVALLLASPGGKGNSDVRAINSALATPSSMATGDATDLSAISAALILVGQSTCSNTLDEAKVLTVAGAQLIHDGGLTVLCAVVPGRSGAWDRSAEPG
jgi:hypothetical protein